VDWQFSTFMVFKGAKNSHIPVEKNRSVCHYIKHLRMYLSGLNWSAYIKRN